MAFKLTTENADAYLRDAAILPEAEAASSVPLGGGVSNRVIQVKTESECYVLKQPLENLDVGDDWPADIARVHNEAAATRAYNQICEDIEQARTPQVVHESDDSHVVVFTCVPSGSTMWKQELLEGRVDIEVAKITGTLLATVHATAAEDPELREAFADKTPFEQLRVDPYHRTIAKRHPDVAELIHDEIARLLDVERTLVHGDYSPKNILVTRSGSPTVWALDFEVAHWGDPAFDTAFMLNHLFIKSIYNHEDQERYFDAIDAFWTAYSDAAPWKAEATTVRELAILMLARVDGKSPVEYLESNATTDVLRAVAKRTLETETETIDGFRDIVEQMSDQL